MFFRMRRKETAEVGGKCVGLLGDSFRVFWHSNSFICSEVKIYSRFWIFSPLNNWVW